jgi:hypothetical protein
MKPEIIDIADSLGKKDKEKFLELTEKINIRDPWSYNHLNLKEYLPLLKKIDDLYDGKIDYITDAISRISGEHWKKKEEESRAVEERWKKKTEKLISEFVKL